MSSSACADDTYSLPVTGCRDNFDFTLLFEATFLSIVPSSIFLLLAFARLRYLYHKPRRVGGKRFQRIKLVKCLSIRFSWYIRANIDRLQLCCTRFFKSSCWFYGVFNLSYAAVSRSQLLLSRSSMRCCSAAFRSWNM